MSEVVMPEGLNININNSDSNAQEGSTSFLDKLFDIGLKIILPLALLFALIAIVIVVKVVLPLVGFAFDLAGSGIPILGILGPAGGLISGAGTLFGWLAGR